MLIFILICQGCLNFLYGQEVIVAVGEAFFPGDLQGFQSVFKVPLLVERPAFEVQDVVVIRARFQDRVHHMESFIYVDFIEDQKLGKAPLVIGRLGLSFYYRSPDVFCFHIGTKVAIHMCQPVIYFNI